MPKRITIAPLMAAVLTLFAIAACSTTTSVPDTSTQASAPESQEFNPKNAEAYYKRGLAKSAQGQKAEASSDYQKAAYFYNKQTNQATYFCNKQIDKAANCNEKTRSRSDYQDALNPIKKLSAQ